MKKNTPVDFKLQVQKICIVQQGKRVLSDYVSVEEPLEITLRQANKKDFTLAITMRTPGNDQELAAGFLFSEGIICSKNQIQDITSNTETANPDNNIVITLAQSVNFNSERLQRYFFTSSSCGVCGKTSMQALEMMHQPNLLPDSPKISCSLLQNLPSLLHKQQEQYAVTGGTHSSALFSTDGKLLMLREDVGRHNAMDKLVGTLLLEDKLSLLKDAALLVSGRVSFELVQKALMADVPFLAAIGAPTSLAIQLANRHNMTLVGFLKPDGFNVYSGIERII